MGRVKEKWINNLTDDEIDELYVELMNAEHYIYIEKEDEHTKGKIKGATNTKG